MPKISPTAAANPNDSATAQAGMYGLVELCGRGCFGDRRQALPAEQADHPAEEAEHDRLDEELEQDRRRRAPTALRRPISRVRSETRRA